MHLNVGEEKVSPVDYQFEQLYGLNASDNFLFVFAQKDLQMKEGKPVNFVLADFGLNTGKQLFTIDTDKISAINQLNIIQ